MADNLTSISPLQKELYEGGVNDWLSFNRKRAWNFFGKEPAEGGQAPAAGSSTPASRSSHFAAFVGYNATGGAQPPDDEFATAGSNSYKQANYSGRTMYWPSMITRSALRNSRGSRAAFASLLSESALRAAQYVDIELERYILGDGSGTLGVVSSNTSEDPDASANTFYLTNRVDARKFQVGMYIQPWSARTAGATQQNFDDSPAVYYAQVTGVNLETGMITVDDIAGTPGSNDTLTTGSIITKANNRATTNGQSARSSTVRYEPMGIDGIISDRDSPMETGTTYGGLYGILAPSDYSGSANAGGVSAWASYVNRVSSGSRAYNDTLIQLALSEAQVRSGYTPNVIFTSYGGDIAVWDSRQGIRRSVNEQGISGGTAPGKMENPETGRYIEFGSQIPVVPCRFAPVGIDSTTATSAYTARTYTTSFLCAYTPMIKVKEWHKPRLLDDDGQVLRMQGRTAQFESVLEYQMETIALQRNCHAKVTDIVCQPI